MNELEILKSIKKLLQVLVLVFVTILVAGIYFYCSDVRPLISNVNGAVFGLQDTAIQAQESMKKLDEATVQVKETAEEINKPAETANSLLDFIPAF